MTTRTFSPASDKQIAFITRLQGERNLTQNDQFGLGAALTRGITAREASQIIDWLLGLDRIPAAQAQPGYYVNDDHEVFVVVENKAGTRTYAKRMVITDGRGKWEYAPGVGATLAGLTPLTVEQAAHLGRLHGACVVCGRTLTDPESVERGIGPVCASRLPVDAAD